MQCMRNGNGNGNPKNGNEHEHEHERDFGRGGVVDGGSKSKSELW